MMSEKRVELFIKDEKKGSVIPRLGITLEMDNGDIDIVGTDEEDNKHLICSLLSDGKFIRISSLSDNIGLQVNKNGQILEAK